MPLHASSLHHSSPYRSFTSSHPHDCMATQLEYLHFSVLHVFLTSSHLLDHHTNSSSSLAVIQGSLASLPVILRILCFSVSHNSSSSLAVTVSRFWLLWLLSPFLLVTTGCDWGQSLWDFTFRVICHESPRLSQLPISRTLKWSLVVLALP
jgi:hypothetical protein